MNNLITGGQSSLSEEEGPNGCCPVLLSYEKKECSVGPVQVGSLYYSRFQYVKISNLKISVSALTKLILHVFKKYLKTMFC